MVGDADDRVIGGADKGRFGPEMRTGQGNKNRPWFASDLETSWFPSVPHVHESLSGPARVADLGCGEGWSAMAIAKACPEVTDDGYVLPVESGAHTTRRLALLRAEEVS